MKKQLKKKGAAARNEIQMLRASVPHVHSNAMQVNLRAAGEQVQLQLAPGDEGTKTYSGTAFSWDATIEDQYSFVLYERTRNGFHDLRIDPGAFADAIASPSSVFMLWQHVGAAAIGRCAQLESRTSGLWVQFVLVEALAQGAEAVAHLDYGVVMGLSVGFSYDVEDGTTHRIEDRGPDELPLVTVLKANLTEISLVTWAADAGAGVGLAAATGLPLDRKNATMGNASNAVEMSAEQQQEVIAALRSIRLG